MLTLPLHLQQLLWAGLPAAVVGAVQPLKASPVARGALTSVACGALLAVSAQQLPRGSFEAVMQVSLMWMESVHLVHVATQPTGSGQALPRRLGRVYGELAWYGVPVEQQQQQQQRSTATMWQRNAPWLRAVAVDVALAVGKQWAVQLLHEWLLRSMVLSRRGGGGGGDGQFTAPRLLLYTALFGAMVLMGNGDQELIRAAVAVASGGRLRVHPFNDWAVLSTSLGEFWGRRYNFPVSQLLRHCVYQPLRQRGGWRRETATLAAWSVSAALHMHVAYVAWGTDTMVPSLLFFLVHGVACGLEYRYRRQLNRLPPIARWALTATFLFASLPLYLSHYVTASPNWLLRNRPPVFIRFPTWAMPWIPAY